mmetsp:Transcript_108469/g.337040  ORF Transcript_108469/g.337040 Transcript_108469/m.337040 type:complete len:276 (+) Transcript_108469:247-1074(+)
MGRCGSADRLRHPHAWRSGHERTQEKLPAGQRSACCGPQCGGQRHHAERAPLRLREGARRGGREEGGGRAGHEGHPEDQEAVQGRRLLEQGRGCGERASQDSGGEGDRLRRADAALRVHGHAEVRRLPGEEAALQDSGAPLRLVHQVAVCRAVHRARDSDLRAASDRGADPDCQREDEGEDGRQRRQDDPQGRLQPAGRPGHRVGLPGPGEARPGLDDDRHVPEDLPGAGRAQRGRPHQRLKCMPWPQCSLRVTRAAAKARGPVSLDVPAMQKVI